MRSAAIRLLYALLIVAGLGLHVYVSFVDASEVSPFALGLLAWSALPYVAAFVLALIAGRAMVGLLATALVLAVDAWTYYEVFLDPTASTAALALLWMPLWNLVLVVPLGAGVAWGWLRARTRRRRAR